MKLYAGEQRREEYLDAQIRRSQRKFRLCKVSLADVRRYRRLLGERVADGPIACLGTRNGREIDAFRVEWFQPALRHVAGWTERRTPPFLPRLPLIESWGRSDVARLDRRSVIGVEVNPDAARSDVWIGSFDDMPPAWAGRFQVVYSNSFDQSLDPERSAREWRRILAPGGVLIVCFTPDATPTATDRVGGLHAADLVRLFGAEPLYVGDRTSRAGYSEVIFRP